MAKTKTADAARDFIAEYEQPDYSTKLPAHVGPTWTGQQLIDRLTAFISAYVSVSPEQALTCALFALHTWVYEAFFSTPYLEIWSAVKRSGKTTLAEVLITFARGGIKKTTSRVISMAKVIEALDGKYVPVIEEAERFNKGTLGEERASLADGYRKGGVHEVFEKGTGVRRWRMFCPKIFVLLGNVHEIIRDRCVSIRMLRNAAPQNWTMDQVTGVAQTNAGVILAAWGDMIKHAKTSMATASVTGTDIKFHPIDPSFLDSPRDREIWLPLFSLAQALRLNAATMALLERAARDLSHLKTLPPIVYHPSQIEGTGESDAHDASLLAIKDMKTIFAPTETFITSRIAVERMHALPKAPWRTWHGEGLNERTLAMLLDRYAIHPKQKQLGKGRKDRVKGSVYYAAEVHAAKMEV